MHARFSAVVLTLLVSLTLVPSAWATYSPRQGRFLQADPIGYKEGINLYQYCRSNPLVSLDPSGTTTIATKIMKTLAWRITIRSGGTTLGNRLWDWALGSDYEYQDDEHEMLSLSHSANQKKVDDFYLKFFQTLELPEGQWSSVDIPFQSAKALVGQFAMRSFSRFDTGWWLNGAHDVRVSGSARVCKSGSKFYVEGLQAKWQWHDMIDAKDYWTLIKDKENIIIIGLEGGWDILVDKIVGADFYAIIHFQDSVAKGTYPPGILRR